MKKVSLISGLFFLGILSLLITISKCEAKGCSATVKCYCVPKWGSEIYLGSRDVKGECDGLFGKCITECRPATTGHFHKAVELCNDSYGQKAKKEECRNYKQVQKKNKKYGYYEMVNVRVYVIKGYSESGGYYPIESDMY